MRTAQIIPMPPTEDNQGSIIQVTDTWFRLTAHHHGQRLTFFGCTSALAQQRYEQYRASDRFRRKIEREYLGVQQLGSSRRVRRLQPGMQVQRHGSSRVHTIAATGETRGRCVAWLNGVRGAVPINHLRPVEDQPVELDALA